MAYADVRIRLQFGGQIMTSVKVPLYYKNKQSHSVFVGTDTFPDAKNAIEL